MEIYRLFPTLWFIPVQIDNEQAELARSNFAIVRKEAQSVLDLVSSCFGAFLTL